MKNVGVYLHIPFCNGKCPYCDFYSITGNEEIKSRYTKKIVSEIEKQARNIDAIGSTLYIGGGTPNVIGMENISLIIKSAIDKFKISDLAEKTIEINPTKGKEIDFDMLKKRGINRVSIGLQSANQNELNLLGRKHTPDDVKTTVERARKADIHNISLDLMIGTSNQTKDSLEKSIDFCTDLDVEHISMYMLKIEEGTVYFDIRDTLNLPSDDDTADLYLFACKELSNRGFNQYEISNFSKEGKESKHNLLYWNQQEYIGIGPSAHSFVNGKRFFYGRDINDFIKNSTQSVEYDSEYIENGSKEEYLMLKLRLKQGVNFKEYYNKFGENIPKEMLQKVKQFRDLGLMESDFKSKFNLTTRGFLVSNQIIEQLI